jgi:hypothetical protein
MFGCTLRFGSWEVKQYLGNHGPFFARLPRGGDDDRGRCLGLLEASKPQCRCEDDKNVIAPFVNANYGKSGDR